MNKKKKKLSNNQKRLLKKQRRKEKKEKEIIEKFGSIENYKKIKKQEEEEIKKLKEIKWEKRLEEKRKSLLEEKKKFPLSKRKQILENLKCPICNEKICFVYGKKVFYIPKEMIFPSKEEKEKSKIFLAEEFLNYNIEIRKALFLILKNHIRHEHSDYEDNLEGIKEKNYRYYKKDNLDFNLFREMKNLDIEPFRDSSKKIPQENFDLIQNHISKILKKENE